MKLSKRLMAIAKLIQKHSNHGYLADIGSDHGYLPCWLVEHDVVEGAYACEIADGPLQACLATVQLCHMEDKITSNKSCSTCNNYSHSIFSYLSMYFPSRTSFRY